LFGEGLAHQNPPHAEGTKYHQTIWAVKSYSCALALFQNIVKTLKQREPSWITCVPCSYFGKVLYLF